MVYTNALKYIRNNQVDLILATGEPFILHKFAYKLSRKTNTPYMLDYRDGWTTRDDNLKLKGFKRWLNNYFFRRYETTYLKFAHCVVTSNPFELPKIREISPKNNVS